MRTPEPLPHEAERLKSLFQQDLLDTPQEPEFNRIVNLAARLFGVKIVLISLVDDCRQWFKAKVGLAASETPAIFPFVATQFRGQTFLKSRIP